MRAAYSLIPMMMLSWLMSGCGGGGGGDGAEWAALAASASASAAAAAGPTTGPGTVSVTVSKTLLTVNTETPGAHCASGGMRIEAGLDSDDDGVLSAGEVASTQYLCPGSAGAAGMLVQMRDEPSGAHCAAGGKAIDVGSDGNANGLLEAAEITSTGYVCNSADSSHVASGLNTLASIVSEAAGANCAYGGIKNITGPDSNANGVLDADEVSATSYLCNCAPGAGIDVTGTAVQAQPNMCYIARNDAAQVVLTLPADPAVGDRVRLSGAGPGGWKIAQNPGQAVYTQSLGGMAGANWTPHESDRNWFSVASSADGNKLVAVDGDLGQIYTSTDAGATWTTRESTRYWVAAASSADGNKLVAVEFGGQIYTSTDSGVSWTARESHRNWYSVASSADGSKLMAVVYGGQIYTSTDSGVSWTPRESTRFWEGASASSADGSKLVAVESGGQIYTSTDSGVSWTARDTARPWLSLASSADGSKLVAATFGGALYTSIDSGATWTARESNRNWHALVSSADGSKLMAAVKGGRIYTSIDSGVSWTARESDRGWFAAASSADGSKLVAVVYGGRIYTSVAATTLGAGGSISGTASDAIELQYVGNGMFTVLSHQGSLTIQ